MTSLRSYNKLDLNPEVDTPHPLYTSETLSTPSLTLSTCSKLEGQLWYIKTK